MPAIEIKLEDIYFNPEVQHMCVTHSFTCPHYDHSHSCPPNSPYLEDTIRKFKKFYLIYSMFDMEEYIKKEKSKHPNYSDKRIRYFYYMTNLYKNEDLEKEFAKFLDQNKQSYTERLLLYDGVCRICFNDKDGGCTFDDGKPCRYPNRKKFSMEAVGIEVTHTVLELENRDFEYPSPKYEYRFGLACFI